MLVLSRKRLETLRIGDDVTVTIVDIRGDKVRIGVEAPKDKIVYRQEVWERENRTNEEGEKL
jgi:carbon storage regulator